MFENLVDHLPGAAGGGIIGVVLTGILSLYMFKRKADTKDREQDMRETKIVNREYRLYAASIRKSAAKELARMQKELDAKDCANQELQTKLKDVDRRLDECEDDRRVLKKFRKYAERRFNIRPEDYEDEDSENTPPTQTRVNDTVGDDDDA